MGKIKESLVFPKHLPSSKSPAKILIINTQRKTPILLAYWRKTILSLLEFLRISTDEITVHFVSEPKIAELHQQFFNDPTPTDCISFPIDLPKRKSHKEYHVLGEVFVCPAVAVQYAEKHNIDPQHELLRYVIHGILHLIGYDDIHPNQRRQMKRKERICLNHILNSKQFR